MREQCGMHTIQCSEDTAPKKMPGPKAGEQWETTDYTIVTVLKTRSDGYLCRGASGALFYGRPGLRRRVDRVRALQVRRCELHGLYRINRGDGEDAWHITWAQQQGVPVYQRSYAIAGDPVLEGHPWSMDPGWQAGDEYRVGHGDLERVRDGKVVECIPGAKWREACGALIPWLRSRWGAALNFDSTGMWGQWVEHKPATKVPLEAGQVRRKPNGTTYKVLKPNVGGGYCSVRWEDSDDERLRSREACLRDEVVPKTAEGAARVLLAKALAAKAIDDVSKQADKAAQAVGELAEAVALKTLTREELIAAVIGARPKGLMIAPWAYAVPRAIAEHERWSERRGMALTYPETPAALKCLTDDIALWSKGQVSALSWQRLYDEGIIEHAFALIMAQRDPVAPDLTPWGWERCVRAHLSSDIAEDRVGCARRIIADPKGSAQKLARLLHRTEARDDHQWAIDLYATTQAYEEPRERIATRGPHGDLL